ncbi:hypothetical protein ASG01_05325 [Chryseobacterium sp. Leaf180]|jgi:hypothetical protein|uniref:hypothetical protein n=1 Tax=Chryseobacterium sp. Leaf180 TaxID=1736289 RepID=UPI0006FD0235|nr:hypothetical protein [Chryseobacterium sp. Leaf180]KQR95268.1 hypothetical protein ASG01_05325 [Chryseobacterium sp. Leaf180]
MKNIILYSLLIFLISGSAISAQEKKKFTSIEQVLARITPNDKVDYWVLVHNLYGKNREVRSSGTKKDYLPQFSGFNIVPNENSFYYIAYSQAGKTSYITTLEDLKTFIGKADNAEEAALKAVFEGYFIDEEFIDVAANYREDTKNFYLDLGKITMTECPYQKSHFMLTVDKKSGEITSAKDNGAYMELYNKKCKNNPRLLKIEKKEEPKEDPKKKQPIKKKR